MRQLIAVSVLVIVAFAIFRDRTPPETTASTISSTSAPIPPVVPQKLTAAELKSRRQAMGKAMQEYLWENGYEMKVEVRGTTLHVYYILAGNALAYQFGKFFVAKSESSLHEAGFKKVVLESDDHYWVWNLG